MINRVVVRWASQPGFLGEELKFATVDQNRIDAAKQIIELSSRFEITSNAADVMKGIRRNRFRWTFPDVFPDTWNIAVASERVMPEWLNVTDKNMECLRSTTQLPVEVESQFPSINSIFDDMYVVWNKSGDAALFAKHGFHPCRRVLIVQWSIGHEPPDLAALAANPETSWPQRINAALGRFMFETIFGDRSPATAKS